MGCERSREKKKMMRRQDVGGNRKWGWPTGTRVICSIRTECGFDFKTLHGLGSQMPVRNQKQNKQQSCYKWVLVSWWTKYKHLKQFCLHLWHLVFSRRQHACQNHSNTVALIFPLVLMYSKARNDELFHGSSPVNDRCPGLTPSSSESFKMLRDGWDGASLPLSSSSLVSSINLSLLHCALYINVCKAFVPPVLR